MHRSILRPLRHHPPQPAPVQSFSIDEDTIFFDQRKNMLTRPVAIDNIKKGMVFTAIVQLMRVNLDETHGCKVVAFFVDGMAL